MWFTNALINIACFVEPSMSPYISLHNRAYSNRHYGCKTLSKSVLQYWSWFSSIYSLNFIVPSYPLSDAIILWNIQHAFFTNFISSRSGSLHRSYEILICLNRTTNILFTAFRADEWCAACLFCFIVDKFSMAHYCSVVCKSRYTNLQIPNSKIVITYYFHETGPFHIFSLIITLPW